MDIRQEANWKKAQATIISTNIVEDAQQQLLFLASVDRYPCLYEAPALQIAIMRYEQCWLPLLATHREIEIGDAKTSPVPPLDCEWVWHCHRLNPVQYAIDCKQLYGRVLDASAVHVSVKDSAITETAKLWNNAYPGESYVLDLNALLCISDRYKYSCKGKIYVARKIQYDLAEAVQRHREFFYQVSGQHILNESFLRAAEERYKGFLHIVKNSMSNPVKFFAVPTYDIDLMWHSHQLNPAAYAKDMVDLMGKLLEHDDKDTDRSKGSKLDAGFADTAKEWEYTFGTRYWRAGAMYRGDPPSPVPRSPQTLVDKNYTNIFQHEQHRQKEYLAERETMRVMLEIVRAKNVAVKSKGGLFARYYVQNAEDAAALDTKEVFASSKPEWRYASSFDCAVTGNLMSELIRSNFLVIELRFRSPTLVGKLRGSKLLGRVNIPWQAVFESPTLSIENWFVLSTKEAQDVDSKPPSLHLAVSVTPPATASYKLMLSPTSINSYNTNGENGWLRCIRRTSKLQEDDHTTLSSVLDHANNEIFSVQTRYLRSDSVASEYSRRQITIFQKYNREFEYVSVTAAEVRSTRNAGVEWALFGKGGHELRVNRCGRHILYELKGSELGYPWRLLRGRRLQYQVQKTTRTDDQEEFVTLVRYTSENPAGKATALFNWKSGAIEVERTECAALVVLLCALVSASASSLHRVYDSGGMKTRALSVGSAEGDSRRNRKRRMKNLERGEIWGRGSGEPMTGLVGVLAAADISLGCGCGDGGGCGA